MELSIGKSIHGNENTSLSTTISPITINPSKIWSNSDFFDHLLNYTNYDKRVRPFHNTDQIIQVKNSIYLNFLGHLDTVEMKYDVLFIMRQRLQFKIVCIYERLHFLDGQT